MRRSETGKFQFLRSTCSGFLALGRGPPRIRQRLAVVGQPFNEPPNGLARGPKPARTFHRLKFDPLSVQAAGASLDVSVNPAQVTRPVRVGVPQQRVAARLLGSNEGFVK